jgi:hypothetical protein
LLQAECLKEDRMLMSWLRTTALATMALGVSAFSGCGSEAKTPDAGKAAATSAGDACEMAGWCTEHGVPEDICAQCNPKVAAEYKKKGDWCKEHNRPESQCFLCNPKLEAKFAQQYESKYGQKPPKRAGT